MREELGDHHSVVAANWAPFARGCGQRCDESTEPAAATRVVFVGTDIADVLVEAAQLAAHSDDDLAFEFGLVVPAGLLGRNPLPIDPTLQLWQNGYTPVTVHRVPVDTGHGIVEVVVATVRPTPPRP